MSYSEWLADQDITITLSVDVGEETVLIHEENGMAIDVKAIIEEIEAQLGLAQRNLIPSALQEQFEFEREVEND